MKKMRVIGIGSLIMADDGIGTRVAQTIRKRLGEQGIEVLVGETDVSYCLDEICPDNFLVLIDAVMSGKEPGSIEIFPLQDAHKSHGKLNSQHDYSLIDALSLNFPDIQGYLIGIEAAEIGFGFELSNALGERFGRICDEVLQIIIRLKEEAPYARHASY